MTSDPVAIVPLAHAPDAVVRPPGSKSHTNRALVCAALAVGRSRLDGVLVADDTEAMFGALEALGIGVELDREAKVAVVDGVGGRLPPGPRELDVRRSGTTGRFLLPVLALGTGTYRLDGHEQLRVRPFGDLVEAMIGLGVQVSGDRLPIDVTGPSLAGGRIPVSGSVSSQFLSGLLLAAPCAAHQVTIDVTSELVSRPYVALTLGTMRSFGATVAHTPDLSRFAVAPTGYQAVDLDIEPDASAASYFFAAAAMTGGRVRVQGLSTETVQGDVAFVRVLADMGAEVTWGPDWIEVSGGRPLNGVEANLADFSDTAQTLAIVATMATSPTRIDGIDFIRRKETDRIAAVVTQLNRLGIRAEATDDGMVIHPGRPVAGVVDTYDDHRMAMSFALLGLVHEGIEIADPDCVAKTYPSYFSDLDQLRRR